MRAKKIGYMFFVVQHRFAIFVHSCFLGEYGLQDRAITW